MTLFEMKFSKNPSGILSSRPRRGDGGSARRNGCGIPFISTRKSQMSDFKWRKWFCFLALVHFLVLLFIIFATASLSQAQCLRKSEHWSRRGCLNIWEISIFYIYCYMITYLGSYTYIGVGKTLCDTKPLRCGCKKYVCAELAFYYYFN